MALVREIVSLLGWLVAFLSASLFAGPLGEQLPDYIPTPELRAVAAFLAGEFTVLLLHFTVSGAQFHTLHDYAALTTGAGGEA